MSYLSQVWQWLPELDFFDDRTPRSAARNMAADEVLLGLIERPLFRVYRWERPAVSLGYFERWRPIQAAHPERDPVRRWTGGGVVLHGGDFTYSILVPHSWLAAGGAPAKSYAAIHGALCAALTGLGQAACLASSAPFARSRACFENPVLHDVLVNGEKIAGAAQRRMRLGLIHQGSVQNIQLPDDFGLRFAGSLAPKMHTWQFEIEIQINDLAEKKYACAEWLERVL